MNKEIPICPEEAKKVLKDMFGLQNTMEAKPKPAFEPHSSIPGTYVHIETGEHYTRHENKEGHLIYSPKQTETKPAISQP